MFIYSHKGEPSKKKLTLLGDISVKGGGGKTIVRFVFVGKKEKMFRMFCLQEYAKKFHNIFVRVFANTCKNFALFLEILKFSFSSLLDIFLSQDHPFLHKRNAAIDTDWNLFFLDNYCMSVKARGGGALADTWNVIFLDGSPNREDLQFMQQLPPHITKFYFANAILVSIVKMIVNWPYICMYWQKLDLHIFFPFNNVFGH